MQDQYDDKEGYESIGIEYHGVGDLAGEAIKMISGISNVCHSATLAQGSACTLWHLMD